MGVGGVLVCWLAEEARLMQGCAQGGGVGV